MRKLIDEFDSLPYRVEIENHSETGFPFLNKQGTKEQASKKTKLVFPDNEVF